MRGITILTITLCILLASSTFSTSNTSYAEESEGIPRGNVDPTLKVEVFDPSRTWNGTTIFGDIVNRRIVEVNMLGEVVWQYNLNAGMGIAGVMVLPNNNILFAVPNPERYRGCYEVNRESEIVWRFVDNRVSHDCVRLANGNTLITAAHSEDYSVWPYVDPQVFEIDRNGNIIWSFDFKSLYADDSNYKDIRSSDWGPWTHANGALRLPDGSTLMSPRNFNIVIAVDSNGNLLKTYGESCSNCGPSRIGRIIAAGRPMGRIVSPHSPIILPNGNLLVSETGVGRVIEFNEISESIEWQWPFGGRDSGTSIFVRAAQRLPNDNTLVTDSNGRIFEVTKEGHVVWKISCSCYDIRSDPRPFFQAERVTHVKPMVSIPLQGGLSYQDGILVLRLDKVDTDLSTIWVTIHDISNNKIVVENSTYTKNLSNNMLDPVQSREGTKNFRLGDGSYLLTLQANSTGWGYKDFIARKKVNLAHTMTNFHIQSFKMDHGDNKFDVLTLSSVKVSELTFNQPSKQIKIQFDGTSSRNGFINISLPNSLIEGPYTVITDDVEIDANVKENGTRSFVFFSYSHNTGSVEIIGTSVVSQSKLMITTRLAIIVGIVIISLPLIMIVMRKRGIY